MMQIYKNLIRNSYYHESEITQDNWVKVITPTAAERLKMNRQLGISSHFIAEALDLNTRPMIEKSEGITYIIIHVPTVNREIEKNSDGIRYRTVPFGIALTGTHLVTICSVETPQLRENFIRNCQGLGKERLIQNTLDLLHHTAQRYLKLMHTMEHEIAEAEEELSRSYRNSELYTLLYLNDGLLDMTISLKQMLHLMRKINHEHHLELIADGQELFDDTIIELEQAYSVAEINQLNANNVMDAYGNIIQNNVSHVVKLLTAMTIVLSIPTLIASIYGMNVPLPYQDAPEAFMLLIAIMVVLSGIVAGIFFKKRFF